MLEATGITPLKNKNGGFKSQLPAQKLPQVTTDTLER